MKYYTGNITNTSETIAVLPAPHYWWQAGAMWGLMLDYWHLTNDSSYNNVTTQALLSQVGPEYDYMVPLHQKDEGNDDQAFWGFATMSAAEKGYPQPTIGNYSWLELTEKLWNTQVRRWDRSTCNGGLKWQIFPFNNGYDYKNSISNGAFFQLSARLARFTGNQTYVEWANKSFEWTQNIGLMTPDYHVFDGTDDKINCSELSRIEWTYNVATFLYGSAAMYNYTNGSALWSERTEGLLNATANFFSPYDNATNVMFEPACEPVDTCNTDQFSFKGYLSRFMWATTLLAPFTKNAVTTLLTATSVAVSNSCSGGADGAACGTKWYIGGFDGITGIGQQMSALETIQGLLTSKSRPPMHCNEVHLKAAPSASSVPVPTQLRYTSAPTPRSVGNMGARADAGQLLWVTVTVMLSGFGLSTIGIL